MALKLITPPAEEPVDLAAAKLHLRVDGNEDDTPITALIIAGREWAESILRRALITQTWELVLDAFPEDDVIKIPLPPLQSVTSIKYTDEDGNETTFPAASYVVDTDSAPGRVALAANATWPSVALQAVSAVRIRFDAGYGLAAAVPQVFKSAILLLVGHLYENREEVASDARLRQIPLGAKRLLWPKRVLSQW